MKIGFWELIVVFVVALMVIGPDKLPYYAKKLGAGLQEFRKATKEVSDELRENVVEPLNEAQQPLREAFEPLEELDREVRGTVKDMEKSFRDIGKPQKAKTASAGKDPQTEEGAEADSPVAEAPEADEKEAVTAGAAEDAPAQAAPEDGGSAPEAPEEAVHEDDPA